MQKFKEKFFSVFPDFKAQLAKTLVGFSAIMFIVGILFVIKMNADFPALGLFVEFINVVILILGSYQLGHVIMTKIGKKE